MNERLHGGPTVSASSHLISFQRHILSLHMLLLRRVSHTAQWISRRSQPVTWRGPIPACGLSTVIGKPNLSTAEIAKYGRSRQMKAVRARGRRRTFPKNFLRSVFRGFMNFLVHLFKLTQYTLVPTSLRTSSVVEHALGSKFRKS